MANLALLPMRYSYSQGLYSTAVDFSQQEAASATFSDGALVVAGGAGTFNQCGANPVRIDGVAIGAGHNDSVAGTHNIMFTLPNEDMVYEVSIDKASAQAGALAVLAQTDVGNTIGVTLDTIGSSPAGTALYWYADVDKKAANQRLLIIGFPAFSPAGTVNGRVYVKFLQAQVLQ